MRPETRYRLQLPRQASVDRPPFEETPLGMLVSTIILLSLIIGIPFLLWLVGS